jgi:anhydro-N-acetylmuramic acid kinase
VPSNAPTAEDKMTDTGAPLTAVGLMSGTSLDGIDAAVIESDGHRILGQGPAVTLPYDEDFRAALKNAIGDPNGASDDLARDLTLRHVDAVRFLLASNGIAASSIDVIGFHGQTIFHRPADRITRQIGDGALLAERIAIPVVDDFRSRDVAAGGEGAPLAPLYHAALADELDKPLCVLNIGGVANLTWIGADGAVLGMDTGPGGALLDDWVRANTDQHFDRDGALAGAGRVDRDALAALLDDPYFDRPPPKSLDRDHFDAGAIATLSSSDGAATLTAFTTAAVARAVDILPAPPGRWLVSGGGRHNPVLMAALNDALAAPVTRVEAVGWDGDALEAQAFAHLAVRSLKGLPLSLPTTTGVPEPTSGGSLHSPA